MHRPNNCLASGWWLAVTLWLLIPGLAASQEDTTAIELPANPQSWLNARPWTVGQLSGKAALFYFFEEQCPRCRARWPDLNRLKEQHADDPILFVAVSSGTDRRVMQNYVRQNDVTWTVLLDFDRSFEQACEIPEISLENITQVAILGPDGTWRRGNWDDLEATVADALNGASWTVDPKSIPDALKPAWQQVEFGNYLPAAAAIRKGLKSNKDDIKQAAETLLAVVQPLIDEKVAAAETAYDAGEKWAAFQAYGELTEQFKGYELPENVEPRKKELQADPTIKAEAAAMKIYQAAVRQLETPAQRRRAVTLLKKLIKDRPDTEAARQAQELLDEMDAS